MLRNELHCPFVLTLNRAMVRLNQFVKHASLTLGRIM
jgi:hypothetical protein